MLLLVTGAREQLQVNQGELIGWLVGQLTLPGFKELPQGKRHKSDMKETHEDKHMRVTETEKETDGHFMFSVLEFMFVEV